MKYLTRGIVRGFLLAAAICLIALPALATDTPRTPVTTNLRADVTRYVWTGLDGDDTGVPVDVSKCRGLSIHVYSGTYGSSTVTVEGSNDPLYASSTEWVGLTDPQGTAISKTADGIEQIEEHPQFLRPKTASGSAATVGVGVICQK